MANYNSRATTFLACLFLLSLLLTSFTAESRKLGHNRSILTFSAPECDTVYPAAKGDTCSTVAEAFGLSVEKFSAINPNLSCTKIFVGEWLCVQGSV